MNAFWIFLYRIAEALDRYIEDNDRELQKSRAKLRQMNEQIKDRFTNKNRHEKAKN